MKRKDDQSYTTLRNIESIGVRAEKDHVLPSAVLTSVIVLTTVFCLTKLLIDSFHVFTYTDSGSIHVHFTKKEISEFLTDPDILRKNIDRLNEKYNTILRELDRLTVLTRSDGSYIIRLQEVKGGPYLRFSKTMVYNPRNVYLYARECLERFMAMKLTGLTGRPMHIFPEGNPIGFFDDKVHDCNLLIPVKEESYPGQEIITIEPSLALILSCNCNIYDCERYFHALWEEAEKLGYKPESHVRIVAFPEILSYSRTDDHIHPMMLGMHVS